MVVLKLAATGLLLLAVAATAALAPDPSAAADCGPEPQLERIAGADRVATAVAVSINGWPTSDAAVLVSGQAFPDALAASVLSLRLNAPTLLTAPDALPAPVAEELRRLGARDVVIVGGRAAVSDAVAAAVTDLGIAVRRIGGRDRYATAAAVAADGGATAPTVALANGAAFADAVSAGALRTPVLLTGAGALHPSATEGLRAVRATDVVVVGGPTAIAETVVEQLAAEGFAVRRVSGPDRYATSAAVGAVALERAGQTVRGALFASGGQFPDALVAAAAAAHRDSVLLLVPPRDLGGAPDVAEVVAHEEARLPCSAVVGGRTAVGRRTAEALAGILGAAPPDRIAPPVDLVAAGDIAACTSQGDEATAALLDQLPGVVVTLGDNAYEGGTAEDFAQCFEPSWGRHRDRMIPVIGNHEYRDDAVGYVDYFGAAAGAAGKFWSRRDLSTDWQLVVLNSNCTHVGCTAGSEQEQWLRAALAAHPDQHVVAVMHHPRASSGGHGGTGAVDSLWKALVEHGVDLALAAHDHNYERFASLGADGGPDPSGVPLFVVGTGGASLRDVGTPKPGSQVLHADSFGLLHLRLESDAFTWRFVATPGDPFEDGGTGTPVR